MPRDKVVTRLTLSDGQYGTVVESYEGARMANRRGRGCLVVSYSRCQVVMLACCASCILSLWFEVGQPLLPHLEGEAGTIRPTTCKARRAARSLPSPLRAVLRGTLTLRRHLTTRSSPLVSTSCRLFALNTTRWLLVAHAQLAHAHLADARVAARVARRRVASGRRCVSVLGRAKQGYSDAPRAGMASLPTRQP